jgi:hypothetical protein
MHEIIYSVFYNDYIIRESLTISTIKPLFIGTHDECITKLLKIKGVYYA